MCQNCASLAQRAAFDFGGHSVHRRMVETPTTPQRGGLEQGKNGQEWALWTTSRTAAGNANEAKCEQDFGQPLSLLAESERRGNDGRMKLILSLAFALSLCSIVQARNVHDTTCAFGKGA
jgi:hypothetical protein